MQMYSLYSTIHIHHSYLIFLLSFLFFFFFNATATTEIYTLSLHDALPICEGHRGSDQARPHRVRRQSARRGAGSFRSEEHTSELQSRFDLVCRLLLEKKKKKKERSQYHK